MKLIKSLVFVVSLLVFIGLQAPHAQAILGPVPAAEFYVPLKGPKMPVISEGWKYSAEETAIHGFVNHNAVDFEARRGTPVYAAADGYAISSFHAFPLLRVYGGKGPIGFGLGNFVQIWHPDLGVYSSYSHLQSVSKSIPYFTPEYKDYAYNPQEVYSAPDFSIQKGKLIKRGTLIGWVGDTGLGWGYYDEPGARPDPKKFPSWDNTHLH